MTTTASTNEVGRHRSRRAPVPQPQPLEDLRKLRAQRELHDFAREDALLRAADAGHTQREIAKVTGEPQATVHRLIRRARARNQAVDPLDAEAHLRVLRYVAGDINLGKLVGELVGLSAGEFAPGNQVDGYVPGSWDQVRSAYLDGLLTENDYEYLRSHLRQKGL